MSEQILIIDDDQDSLKLISLVLRRQEYRVVIANDGKSGLEMALLDQPDLILLDVMMPDMNGLEVCRRLRGQPVTAEIPIIMFTAKARVEDKIEGFEAGVTDYLTKPIHPAELVVRVKNALSIGSRRGEVYVESSPSEYGLSIGFLGAKGGIGTTSLAASVGAMLAQDQTTILTDIRPGQGTLGVSLGISDNSGVDTILSLPSDQIKDSAIVQHLVNHSSKMRLLLSSPNPQETMFNYSLESVLALKKVITSQAYYCLFDLGAGLNRITMPLIRELDRTVVITEPNPMSLTTASAMLSLLRLRIPKEKIRLVISNRTQSSWQISQQEIENQTEHKVEAIIPVESEAAYQAIEAGMALTQFQPDSKIADQISKLVEALVR